MTTPNSSASTGRPSSRLFDSVMIALSAALLVILGIVIGRFVVTTEAVAVVDEVDAELATLRAEIAELNRQLLTAESQIVALDESVDGYRQLAAQQQARADRLEHQQTIAIKAIGSLSGDRKTCLDELHKYVALDQPIDATDVLRFAETVFLSQEATLRQISGEDVSIASNVEFPAYSQPAAAKTNVLPRLPAPNSETEEQGTYFATPTPRRAPSSYVYFAPKRQTQASTFQRTSGITFHTTADAGSEVRR